MADALTASVSPLRSARSCQSKTVSPGARLTAMGSSPFGLPK